MCDDGCPEEGTGSILREYAAGDARIRTVFREGNGGIAAATNDALRLATGDWVAFLDHHAELPPHAPYLVPLHPLASPSAPVLARPHHQTAATPAPLDPPFNPLLRPRPPTRPH